MDTPMTERIAENLFSLIQIFHIMRDRNIAARGTKPVPMEPGYPALCFLMREDLSISELGRRLQRSKPNMTSIIDRLEREGKVRRIASESDRRVSMIRITQEGKKSIERRKTIVKECIKRNLSRLDRAEQDVFCRSLENVNAIAEKLSRD